ncbi:lantibiotic protection ABC transporter ATP-binding protein [Irregularibacter muris]|uniref:Lantibiotic protection ABC transporter ATP-binding protein n=1 Tax=Irregularibacter muris TaxID=1796619 RepID=A0AAE3HI05_9FIRM|nr:lantibiotic protection ABC transporter ATP-binding protein [Irregularibacter muris]MCR1898913.1 lantibiotic protection ABC transporter ATP-binding protein [Irregularibacter muris]
MKNIIETSNLTKIFKNEKAINGVSIHVKENSVYGLLGPNGAGKSTLLKMLTGVLHPTEGKILLHGREWRRKDLQRIGSMIEGPAIYENLTAYENLEVLALLLKIPKQRIHEVLQIVGLAKTGKKVTKKFSLGMKQRLGIGMALLNQPKILILDEPTNGLDPIGIQELRELIRSFPKKGITVILSSHMLSEVQQVADDIGIISHGYLGFEGKNDQSKYDLEEQFIDIVGKTNREVGLRD